jgi:hypothetical protein
MKKSALTTLIGLVALAAAVPAFAFVGTAELGTNDPLDERAAFNQTGIRTLDPDTLYTLYGLYYVEPGAEIVIPAGTVIQGVPAATLIIKPGATITAAGTWDAPIVFTSSEAPGNRFPGDWGGVVILGNAPVNKEDPLIEGGIIEGTYGGDDPDDNSGVFKYCRIEFPGYRFQLNNEINGLTLGGVGRGTEIHHVQVSYSFDDSYECFGGTVDLHHIVAIGGTDDEFDTDFGYTGRIQFGFAMKDPDFSDPTGSSNGFESDNDGSGSNDWPQTWPIYSNMTVIGPEYVDTFPGLGTTFSNAGVIRRNSRTSIFNSVIAGYPRGMSIRDLSITKAEEDSLRFYTNQVTGNDEYSPGNIHDTGRWPAIGPWFMGNANLDTLSRSHDVVGLGASISLTNPVPIPQPGSPLIKAADFDNPYLADLFFREVDYVGAFDPRTPMARQWTAYWTEFDPQNRDYLAQPSAVGDAPRLTVSLDNHPNPFNPSTNISFSVPKAGFVTLEVFDIRGRKVAEVFKGEVEAREHTVTFNGEGLSSGTYFYRVTGDGFSATEKMQLVK